jgi:hypothetical protein
MVSEALLGNVLQGLYRVQSIRSTITGKYLLPSTIALSTRSRLIDLLFFNRFYCQGRTLLAYTLTTLAAAIAGSIAPFQPVFNEPKNKVGSTLGIINTTYIAHEVSEYEFVHGAESEDRLLFGHLFDGLGASDTPGNPARVVDDDQVRW